MKCAVNPAIIDNPTTYPTESFTEKLSSYSVEFEVELVETVTLVSSTVS